MRCACLIATVISVAGCAAAGPAITSLATAGVAGTVGSATGNAAIGIAAGFAVSYGVDQGVKWGERRITETEQHAIATAAGPLAVGQSAAIHIEHIIPFSDKSGTVEVARAFGDRIPCKDVVFTFAGDETGRIFASTLCRSEQGDWTWALAEPSVFRWGYLQ
jgi:hypothetical protein